jgi:hypothetical protein
VTREHVWPDWFRRFTGEIGVPFPHDQQTEVDGESERYKEWEAPPFSLTVRAFCAPCNNGWMSELEDRAKNLILPFFDSWGRSWHRRQQRDLATWALLRAIVLDQTHPESAAIPPRVVEHLYRERRPPEELKIWLAACNPELVALYSYQGIEFSRADATEPPGESTVHIVTFTMGPLVFHLGGTVLDDFTYFDDIVFPQLDVVRLWPYSRGQLEFAPRRIMSGRTLEVFATAIYDDLQDHVPPGDRIDPVRGRVD